MIVSVVIPVYNRKNFIRDCLESVLSQDFKEDYEVIVVDDGSTDGTVEILKEFSFRIKLHLNQTNQGVSCARNQGIRLSQGRFVAMTDSDCIADPNWLSALIHPFEQDKNIMIVGGKVVDMTCDNYWQLVNKSFNTYVAQHSGYVDRVIGCNMALRREFVLSHPYDERLKFAAGDDTELCWFCRENGLKVFYTDLARVAHHHRSTFKSSFVQQFFYGYVNTYLCMKYDMFPFVPYGSRILLLLLLCLLLGLDGFKMAWVAVAICGASFSYICWFHGTKASVKTLFESIITYPGNYLLYSIFCIGTLVYFLIPELYLKRSDPICIGLASDDRYAPFMGVVLVSLLKNNPKEYFNIFIMNAGISEDNINKTDSLFKNHPNAKITWIKCDTSLFNGLKVDSYISPAAYYRIFLSQFIPEHIDKCLYLDSDVLILDKIRPLWETDLGNHAIAAVQDAYVGETDRAEVLRIPSSDRYFNSGVMLINLKLWRKKQLSLQIIDFIRNNPSKIIYWDQDGLNATLNDRWKSLNERWNKTVFTFYGYGQSLAQPMQGMDFIFGPKILHFAYKLKPWMTGSTDPLRFYYFKYLSQTPWKHLVRKQDNFYDHLIKIFSYLIPLGIFILLLQTKRILLGSRSNKTI